jgi:hypothetical protein
VTVPEPTTPPPVYSTDYAPRAACPPSPASFAERSTYRAAAVRAEKLWPGPVGQLLSRELLAYDEFGWRLSNDSLTNQARDQIMKLWAEHEAARQAVI